MAKLGLALVGGLFILNSYLIAWLLPGQAFAADAAAVIGAVILSLPIFLTALRDLAVGRIHMNELVALAILAAMAGADFRTAGIIAFFLLITIIIEAGTASGAQRSIEALIRLAPTTARKLGEDGEQMVEAAILKVGDVIRVRPGENFPVDGAILVGDSTVNQASITGESLPVDKSMGDDVFAGTQNLTGSLDVRVTRVGEDTTLGQVKELILAAEGSKPPLVRLVDAYAGYYTPAILVIAGVTWWLTGNMRSVIAVLVASCPCALVLATPSAIVAALAAASRLGILIKNVADLELAARVRAFVFDKTGTLTGGVLKVARLSPAPGVEPAELLRVAAATESQSNHPVALALQQLAAEAGLPSPAVARSREIHGKGMEAEIDGALCRVGRRAWLAEQGWSCDGPDQPEADANHAAMSVVHVARGGRTLGWIGFQDAVREGAAESVRQLRSLGVRRCAMFTGDRASVADLVARQVGIEEVRADCLPDGKVAYVEELKRDAIVAVVGDGVNDAPALAAGDLGIAMGAIGSDIAINSASIALMTNDLRRLPLLVVLARRSRLVMYQNLALGLLFIVAGIGFSVFGYLPPVAAAVLHTLSTLVVIFNSARLVRTGEEFTFAGEAAPEASP
jgi:Cd2+/Zn2+-exporting ATPase